MKLHLVIRRYQIIFFVIFVSLSINYRTISESTVVYNPQKYKKLVALTFDDGPHEYFTESIVNILNKYKIKATFFFVGKQIEKYPEIVKFVLEKSQCKIANHTYSHKDLTKLTAQEIYNELYSTDRILKSLSKDNPTNVLPYFRPPGGNYSSLVIQIAQKLGLKMVLWSVFTNDHENISIEELVDKIDRLCVNDKEIILLHSGKETTLKSLDKIIMLLYTKGYKFVTIDEILENENLSS